MQLIIVPGNNKTNQTWGELVRDHYGPRFTSTHLVEYEHWAKDESVIDFDVELVKLREREQSLFPGEQTVVIAKSVGALLVFVANAEGVVKLDAGIFFGIPFAMAADGIFQNDWSAVSTFKVPALAFHNLQDPTADYRFTSAVLTEYTPHIELITTDADDHWYGDFTAYDKQIVRFLQSL